MGAEDWSELEAVEGPALADLRVLDTDTRVSAGAVLLGLDAEGYRHLLVPVPAGTVIREDRGSRGVQIRQRDLLDGATRRRFGDIHCLTPHLNTLFGTVADEMLAAIGERPEDPMRACARVLERWRELLRPGAQRLLGPEQLAGLFAELMFLTDVVRQDPARRIDCWIGPDGGRHDLRRGNTAMEVKASLVREGRMVEIHGVEQLEEPENGELVLALARLESVPDKGRTVADLRRALIDIGVGEHELVQRLARGGYLVADEDAYRHHRFAVRERRVYRVEDDFPRIVRRSFADGRLPGGVMRLVYVIDLSNEPPEPLTEDAEAAVFRRLAGVSP